MKKHLNYGGVAGLACFVAGNLPGWLWLLVPGFAILFYLYWLVDRLAGGLRLFKVSLLQFLIALPPTAFIAYVNQAKPMASQNGIFYASCLVIVLLLLFLAYTNYLIANNLLALARQTGNLGFKISGGLTKIAAFTMPAFGIGTLFLILAQPLFLIGCILYKPEPTLE